LLKQYGITYWHPATPYFVTKSATTYPTHTKDCPEAIAQMPGLRIGNADEITKLGLDPKGRMSLQLDKSRYKLPVSFRARRCIVCMYYV